jgi:hypothetical protein
MSIVTPSILPFRDIIPAARKDIKHDSIVDAVHGSYAKPSGTVPTVGRGIWHTFFRRRIGVIPHARVGPRN